MRRLMWFAIGFTAACAAGAYLISGFWLLLLGAFCTLAVCALLFVCSDLSRKVICVLLGCFVGIAWFWCFDTLYLGPVRQLDGQAERLRIEVTDYSGPTDAGIFAEGKTEIDGRTYRVLLYLNKNEALSPKDVVEGGFRLRYTGGGTQSPTYHLGKGIFLLCYPKGTNAVTPGESIPAKYFPAVLRLELLSLIERIFPRNTAPFAKALLLGDTRDLSYEARSALKVSGIYHIVAVSGMHVSILFALVCLLCWNRRVLIAVFGLPVLFLFAAVAGFSPSIVRACIMQAIMILALLTNRDYDPPTALAAAVLLILIHNPLSITSVSLQLSAGCVAGIFLFSKGIHDYFLTETRLGPAKGNHLKAKLTRWAVGSVSVTLGAMSLTTPLCAVYFGSVSIAGIVTNLLTLWLVSLIFYGVLAACALGGLWLPLGALIARIISIAIQLILWVTKMISKLPVSAVYTSSIYIVAWLIFAYVLLTVFVKTKKKHPVALACCLIAGLLGAIACSWIEPRLDDYRITAVDVGQGQCLILQNEGKYYMVDCGGDSGDDAADRAANLLLSQGIFRLDGLILTHYDADHAAGAVQLLSRVPADAIYMPIVQGEDDLRDSIATRYGDKVHYVAEDLHLDEADITVYPSENTEDANESSLCILFQPEDCDILITGDRSVEGEQALMEHTQLPDLEILVAGHHGSRTSTSWELLNATRPEIVLISVGEDNRYGHPTQETLDRLDLFGCQVFRTDLEGTIILRG